MREAAVVVIGVSLTVLLADTVLHTYEVGFGRGQFKKLDY